MTSSLKEPSPPNVNAMMTLAAESANTHDPTMPLSTVGVWQELLPDVPPDCPVAPPLAFGVPPVPTAVLPPAPPAPPLPTPEFPPPPARGPVPPEPAVPADVPPQPKRATAATTIRPPLFPIVRTVVLAKLGRQSDLSLHFDRRGCPRGGDHSLEEFNAGCPISGPAPPRYSHSRSGSRSRSAGGRAAPWTRENTEKRADSACRLQPDVAVGPDPPRDSRMILRGAGDET